MDLGFDDIENTIGYQPEMEEKCVQLSEQLDWGLGQLWLRILINSWFQQLMMHISSVFTSPQSSNLPYRLIPMMRWSTLAGCGPAEGRRAAGGAGESESRGHLDDAELSAGVTPPDGIS